MKLANILSAKVYGTGHISLESGAFDQPSWQMVGIPSPMRHRRSPGELRRMSWKRGICSEPWEMGRNQEERF